MTAAVEGTRVALGVGGWQVQAPLLAHVAAYERKPGSVYGGLIVAYMVTTALLAVRPATSVLEPIAEAS